MRFSEVSKVLDAGKKIKIKEWKNAYWFKNENGVLMNHDESGNEYSTTMLFRGMWLAF